MNRKLILLVFVLIILSALLLANELIAGEGDTLWGEHGKCISNGNGDQHYCYKLGDWVPNGNGDQHCYGIIEDSAGGAIIVWLDDCYDQDIYVQRIDVNANTLWTKLLYNAVENQRYPQIIPQIIKDDAGGVIIIWGRPIANYSYELHAQRIDANGNMLWGENGVHICNANGLQCNPKIVSDSAGGAVITWDGMTEGGIYAQRIDANGNKLWTENGISVCNLNRRQSRPNITKDGCGGVIISWSDTRERLGDIYAQRIDANGNKLWAENGIHIPHYYAMTKDGNGGAIILQFIGGETNTDIYVQRIDANGNMLWPKNESGLGICICNANNFQFSPKIISDENGGAIITWYDCRNQGAWPDRNTDIYAQRVNANGNTLWPANGIPICNAVKDQEYPQIILDKNGNAIIVWDDYRNYPITGNCCRGAYCDLYAQKINLNGNALWAANGIPVCLGIDTHYLRCNYPLMTMLDNNGDCILIWDDYRNGNFDIYAQKIEFVPPKIIIGKITTLIQNTTQTISGTKTSDVTEISVTCSTADVSNVSYDGNTWSCALSNLSEGTNIISVTAKDEAGNEISTVAVGIIKDTTPPTITITSPPTGFKTNSDTATVSGTVSDNTEIAQVTVNGQIAVINGNTFIIDGIALDEGMNIIMVQATDAVGNAGSASIMVIKDTPPKKVHGLQAKDTPEDNGSSITLTWTNNTEKDLKHYNIYRSREPITGISGTSPIGASQTNRYIDNTTTDRINYHYAATAVDKYGNESAEVNDSGPVCSYDNLYY